MRTVELGGKNWRYAIGAAAFAIAWIALPEAARPQAEPPIEHGVLEYDGDERTGRMHRFRIRVARMRADVFDLGFKLPVSGALGDTAFVVNGGYWWYHRGRPQMMGWVVSGGRQLSALRKQLDGGVLLVQSGRARIVKSAGFDPNPEGVELGVQCKPRLVEAGQVVRGLHTEGRTARTAVCTRDGGATLDVFVTDPRSRGPTLAALGDWLAAQGCDDALNLDGGPSTAAAFRTSDGVLRLGAGTYLPYAIRFTARH